MINIQELIEKGDIKFENNYLEIPRIVLDRLICVNMEHFKKERKEESFLTSLLEWIYLYHRGCGYKLLFDGYCNAEGNYVIELVKEEIKEK